MLLFTKIELIEKTQETRYFLKYLPFKIITKPFRTQCKKQFM